MCTDPELDQVESVLRALAEQLLQAAFLFGEFVVDLPDVDALQQRVAVAQAALADVHKQVLVVLRGRRGEKRKARVKRLCPVRGMEIRACKRLLMTVFGLETRGFAWKRLPASPLGHVFFKVPLPDLNSHESIIFKDCVVERVYC